MPLPKMLLLARSALLLLPAVLAFPAPQDVSATDTTALPAATGTGLNTLAVAAGLEYFGSATDNGELSDAPYLAILSNTSEIGQITPGNSMKWDATEPTQNSFSYSGGEVIANLAATNGQRLRCHTLVWHSQLPSWVTSGTWTNATLTAALINHITNVVQHFGSACASWDVVNEALNEDGTYRDTIFYSTIGPSYIAIAFAAAAAALPANATTKLYYNDYNLENPGAKASGAQAIIRSLQSSGVRIDGVGLQAHLIVGSTPSQAAQETNIANFAALGVEVAYTELDIRMTLPVTDALLAQQKADYRSSVGACVSTPGCIGVTVWDYTDRYSWVPSVFAGEGAPLPWDEALVKKPAYDGIVEALTS